MKGLWQPMTSQHRRAHDRRRSARSGRACRRNIGTVSATPPITDRLPRYSFGASSAIFRNIEAVGSSVPGGVAGVMLGLAAAFVFALAAEWTLIVNSWAVASAMRFSTLTAILFDWYPALRASRLVPIEAIRAV